MNTLLYRSGLSDRQLQILTAIANGLSRKEMSSMFSISVKTVDAHVLDIRKLLQSFLRIPFVGVAEMTHFAIVTNLVALKFVESPLQKAS